MLFSTCMGTFGAFCGSCSRIPYGKCGMVSISGTDGSGTSKPQPIRWFRCHRVSEILSIERIWDSDSLRVVVVGVVVSWWKRVGRGSCGSGRERNRRLILTRRLAEGSADSFHNSYVVSVFSEGFIWLKNRCFTTGFQCSARIQKRTEQKSWNIREHIKICEYMKVWTYVNI